MKSLNQLTKGEHAYIVDMRDNTVVEELFNLGCFPGDSIYIEENDFRKNMVIVRHKNFVLPIHRLAAEQIITNVVHFEFCLN